MELIYKSKDGRLTVKFDEKTQVELWEQVADFQSVFDRDNVCGVCNSNDVSFQVRTTADGDKYYEKKCNKAGCYAKLAYHQNKKGGTLYRQWSDKWEKYVPKAKEE